jgi:threonine/homoserine/homoserine lactone efflux protein
MTGELAAFLALSAVVICTPGPDTALTVRNALIGGRSGGVWTAGGVAAGQAIWTGAASLGVATLLHASEPAFIALKLAGAAYLVYLGVMSLRSAWSGRSRHGLDAPRAALTPARAFRQGLLNDLGNPKMAAFFTSLLPQVVPAGRDGGAALVQLLTLGFAFCLLTFAWLAAYSVVLARARRFLDRPRWRRSLDAVAGGVLVAFGIRLAASEPS